MTFSLSGIRMLLALFVVFVLLMGVRLPLGLFVPDQTSALSVRAVRAGNLWLEGTFWDGHISDLPAPFKDGHIKINGQILPFLAGKAGADYDLSSLLLNSTGAITVQLGGSTRLDIDTLKFDLSGLPAPLNEFPLAGQIHLKNAALEFAPEGHCITASGALETDMLSRSFNTNGRRPPQLTGFLSCRDGRLQSRLTGATDETIYSLHVTTDFAVLSGRLQVTNPDLSLAFALTNAGFSQSGGSFWLTFKTE